MIEDQHQLNQLLLVGAKSRYGISRLRWVFGEIRTRRDAASAFSQLLIVVAGQAAIGLVVGIRVCTHLNGFFQTLTSLFFCLTGEPLVQKDN
jgi:hypothetical protein